MSDRTPPVGDNRPRAIDSLALSGWLYADLLLGLMVVFLASVRGLTPQQAELLASTATSLPTPTLTVTATPTPTIFGMDTDLAGEIAALPTPPTATVQPTYTPYPTQTPLPTYTPYPTATPSPTASSSATPTKTSTATPTARPTFTPAPTRAAGLQRESQDVVFFTDAAALLSSSASTREQERQRVRQQIRTQLGSQNSEQKAGIVLTFGTAPSPGEGNQLAHAVNELLVAELPDVFEAAVFRDFHFISPNISRRGEVSVEIYFLYGPS